jgi:hypothetical protein
MNWQARGLFAALVLSVISAAAILTVEDQRENSRVARAEDFQRLLGGVGFGPAVDLSDGAFSFDPRLDPSDGHDYGPIPGGNCFATRCADSIFYYHALERAEESW